MTLDQINKLCSFNEKEIWTITHLEQTKKTRTQKYKFTVLPEGALKEVKLQNKWYDITDYSSF